MLGLPLVAEAPSDLESASEWPRAAIAPRAAGAAAEDRAPIYLEVALLDAALGGGARDVVCPSHDVEVEVEAPAVAAGAAGEDADAADAALRVRAIRVRGSAPAADGAHPKSVDPLLLLVEPANVGVVWKSLRALPSECKGARLPEGWRALADAVAQSAGGDDGALPLDWSKRGALPRGWLAGGGGAGRGPRAGEAASEAAAPAAAPPTLDAVALDASSLPKHIAIVMDGNGRWANARGLGRSAGHRAGVDSIRRLIRAARRLRIPFLTLYAFSAQNWARPREEVAILMSLLAEFVATDLEELVANGVRLRVSGDLARLPPPAAAGLARLIEGSRGADAELTLCLALS
jgi:hypothetical protein